MVLAKHIARQNKGVGMDNGTIVEFNGLSYTIVGVDGEGFMLIQCNYYGTLRHIHPDNLAELIG